MNEKITFCENCRMDVAYSVESIAMVSTLKNEEYSYSGRKALCIKCGAEVYVAEIEDANLEALYASYRQKSGIILPNASPGYATKQ